MSRQSPCIARALPCSCNLHTSAGADFFVAAVAPLREHDRPLARPRAGKDRNLKTAVIIGPLHVPVAGSLAILEEVCWLRTGFAHIELTPAPLPPQQLTLGTDNGAVPGTAVVVLAMWLQLLQDRP